VPVTEEVYGAFVTKSVRCRLRKLVHAYEAEEAWGTDFREKLDKPKAEGGFGNMGATLNEAERLWLSKKGEAARELQAEGVRQEMACHVDGYTPPRNATDAMMDRVLLEFQRQLLNTE